MQKNENDKNNQEIDIPNFINYENWDQASDKPSDYSEEVDNSGSFIKEINNSLARQVCTDMDENNSVYKSRVPKKKKKSKALRVTFIVLLTLTVLGCFLLFTKPGQKLIISMVGKYIYGNLDYQSTENATDTSDSKEVFNNNGKNTKTPDHIVNILLIGIEEIKNAQNTDSMIIATMNTKDHSLKLTSLMRDLYVEIPGHDNNRLNSAYSKGGIELLYDTIETNFGIKIDGYVMVNFEAFQQIVDLLHGVKVTLTEKEANYLNTTNYISDPANRNVVPGTQIMNGNQALGYCRIRKKPTATESNDFGRTQRQRAVLNAIYDKLKSKNIVQQVMFMNDVLKNVPIKTDIKQKDFNRYLEEAVELKVKEIENYRIPSDGSFENASVKIGSRKASVLLIKDMDATRKEIQDFIYGSSK